LINVLKTAVFRILKSPDELKLASARIAALAIIALFCSGGGAAQKNRSVKPLGLRIKASAKSVCAGTELDLKAVLVNRSAKKIAIDKSGFANQVTFFINKKDIPQKNEDLNGVHNLNLTDVLMRRAHLDPDQSEFIILRPGESFRRTLKISLKEKSFQQPADVSMTIDYSQFVRDSFKGVEAYRDAVTSNEVQFEIKECRDSTKVTPKSR